MDPKSCPDFDDLPKVEGMPQGCAWGVFDKDGKKDVYGTLNFLTPQIVLAAAAEVKEGISISLNWPLNGIKFPLPGRRQPAHNIVTLKEAGMPGDGWDDELEFNTQFSSQWDSLCHYLHQPSGLAYNGAKVTREGLQVATTAENSLPTCDQWHTRGGIVGRGVLVDWKRYADEVLQQKYSALDGHRITVADIEAAAEFQGVEFRHGDILIIHTGYTSILEDPAPDLFTRMAKGTLSGVHGTEETARWFWNRRFAAVAGDAHAFEAIPPVRPDGSVGTLENLDDLVLHQWFLSMFGMPIGELWDLKALAEHCKEVGRYSFMLTSVPLNHPGLIGSPPNALAIF